jgi:pimeloyl-ACP methyl ester carboxylesterase
LHGISDNRRGAEGLAARLGPLGYDVLAYDSRGHGRSQGRFCTYGYYEKRDVSAALDMLQARDAILFD